MTVTLKFILLLVSLMTFIWVVMRIRKSQVKIEDAVFWILFAAILVVMSLIPDLVSWGARIIGVQSEANFIFLSIIFILILKIFRMSIRISQLESKLQTFAQTYAIDWWIQQEQDAAQVTDEKRDKIAL